MKAGLYLLASLHALEAQRLECYYLRRVTCRTLDEIESEFRAHLDRKEDPTKSWHWHYKEFVDGKSLFCNTVI